MTAELKKTGLDYEFLTAVEGREVDLEDTSLIDPSLPNVTQFLAGTAGAALSHLSACQKMIENGLDEVLVLEDDVRLPAGLDSLADAVAAQLTGAEVALLSYGAYGTCELSREGSVLLPSGGALALPINIRLIVSGGAYVITREAAERMVKFGLPVRANPDDWWYFYREGVLDRVRCVMPLPVFKDHKLESTLGSYKLGTGIRARIVWPLVQRKIPLLHQYLGYRRHRIYGRWSQPEFVDISFVEKPSRMDS
jgi:hypothetical protein